MSVRIWKLWVLFATTSCVLAACATARKADYFISSVLTDLPAYAAPAAAEPASRLYRLDLADDPKHAVLFVTGSGCASLSVYLRPYLRGLSGDIAVFALEKPGVGLWDTGSACTGDYLDTATFDSRVDRNIAVLDALAMGAYGDFDRISLIGVSEGGTVASGLAAAKPLVDSVVLIGEGGMAQSRALRLLHSTGRSTVDPDQITQRLSLGYNTREMVYGQTLSYWKSFLDVEPARLLRQSDARVMAVMGEEDQQVPIESLAYLEDAYQGRSSSKLISVRIKGAGHNLIGQWRDFKPDVFRSVSEFLAQE